MSTASRTINSTLSKTINTRTLAPSNTTNVTHTKEAPKTVPAKKIPPYDYKARFLDLLEKHKPIKEELHELKDKYDAVLEQVKQYQETDDKMKQFEDLCQKQQETIESLQVN